jgi:hypothetical protein
VKSGKEEIRKKRGRKEEIVDFYLLYFFLATGRTINTPKTANNSNPGAIWRSSGSPVTFKITS